MNKQTFLSKLNRLMRRPHSGQTVVIVALALGFVLISATAVAIDGANYILTRRNLQHAADAAALAAVEKLTWGATTTEAKAVGITYVYSNTDSTDLLDPITNTIGTGTGLQNGIEVNGQEARVALNQTIDGFFTNLMGIDQMKVSVLSHAGLSRLGLVPIAIRRYDDSNNPKTDFVAREGIGMGWDERASYATAQNWSRPSYGGTMPVWVPNSGYESSLANPGPEVPILGSGVTTNNGVASFNGLISLDVRHIGTPPTKYLSGVTPGTNAQTLKDLESSYFKTGYRNPDAPGLGDQIAVLNGVSNSFAAKMVQDYYKVGSLLPVAVYNGVVWNNPGYSLEVYRSGGSSSSNIGAVPSVITDTVYFDIAIEPDNKVNVGLMLNLDASSISAQTGTELQITLPSTVFAPAKTRTVYPKALAVKQIDPADPPSVAVITVHSYEAYTDVHRYSSVTYRSNSSVRDFTIYGDPQRVVIDRGGSHPATISLAIQGVNGQSAITKMIEPVITGQAGWPSWITASVHPTNQLVTIPGNGNMVSGSLTVSAASNASSGTYDLRIYLRDPGNSSDKQHYVSVQLVITDPWVDSTSDSYVVLEGYTFVKVTGWRPAGVNANEVDGRVVGPYVKSFEELPGGGRLARLIGWNDVP